MAIRPLPTEKERILRYDDFIVSKTDQKGLITYCDDVFMEYCLYSEKELIGSPHNIIRHPDMPASLFKIAWQLLKGGKEVFAYVKNLSKDGGFYWVFANMTPSYDRNGSLIGFYSVRRKPPRKALEIIIPLYAELLAIENEHGKPKGMPLAIEYLENKLSSLGLSYDEFVLDLQSLKD